MKKSNSAIARLSTFLIANASILGFCSAGIIPQSLSTITTSALTAPISPQSGLPMPIAMMDDSKNDVLKAHELRRRDPTTTLTSIVTMTISTGGTFTSTLPILTDSLPSTISADVILTTTSQTATGFVAATSAATSSTSTSQDQTPVSSLHNDPTPTSGIVIPDFTTFPPSYIPLGSPPQQRKGLNTAQGLGVGISVCAIAAFTCFGLLAWRRRKIVKQSHGHNHSSSVSATGRAGDVELSEKGGAGPTLPPRTDAAPTGAKGFLGSVSQKIGNVKEWWMVRLDMTSLKSRVPQMPAFSSSAGGSDWLKRKDSTKEIVVDKGVDEGVAPLDFSTAEDDGSKGQKSRIEDVKGRFGFKRRDTGL